MSATFVASHLLETLEFQVVLILKKTQLAWSSLCTTHIEKKKLHDLTRNGKRGRLQEESNLFNITFIEIMLTHQKVQNLLKLDTFMLVHYL